MPLKSSILPENVQKGHSSIFTITAQNSQCTINATPDVTSIFKNILSVILQFLYAVFDIAQSSADRGRASKWHVVPDTHKRCGSHDSNR